VGVVLGSVVPRPDGPGGEESDCELAAMAAAAMASGAVGPPEVGAVAGVLAVDVGTATATGVGVVGALPACCARMVASTPVASASSSLDLWPSEFEVLDVAVVVVVDWLVPLAAAPLLLALAGGGASELSLLDGGPSLAALLESLLACGVGALLLALLALLLALFAGAALSAAGGGVSAPFCAGGGGGGAAVASFGVFWLTRSPKRSFASGALDRVGRDGAAWNAALAAASWVALSTGRPPARELAKQSAKTGPFCCAFEYIIISNSYIFGWAPLGPSSAPSFLPGGKICRFRFAAPLAVIASREYGLY
jgi:hypothetical protein